jgi:catechol 2,3-dioxygenase-like lactoylglutathione lyase family enzyme
MPNLENLRKQAKQLLRWHRERHHPLAAQIRAHLPRYAHLTDAQILAAPFKLADAQELIARKQGFQDWAALQKGLPIMNSTHTETTTHSHLLGAEPQLFVTDIDASIAFYRDTLGFTVAFTYGTPPFYAQVARDAARLNLRHVDRPVIDPNLRDQQDLLSAIITLDDAKPLFLEFQSASVPFHQTLRTEPWGARTFIVRDPDGNLILFAGKGG